MYSKCYSGSLMGIKGVLVSVEADVRNGLPGFKVVGAMTTSAREAPDRVKIAIENAGFLLPPKHITVNLSPANSKKDGTSYDLPMAISLLAAFGYISPDNLENYLIVGELSLDGQLCAVKGLLSYACIAKENGIENIICPLINAKEAASVDGVNVYGVRSIKELADFLGGEKKIESYVANNELEKLCLKPTIDRICGDPFCIRALVIALAGEHNMLISGNGSHEKKLLFENAMNLRIPLISEEKQEILKIRSVLGEEFDENISFKEIKKVNLKAQDIDEDMLKLHYGVSLIEQIELASEDKLSIIDEIIKTGSLQKKLDQVHESIPCKIRFIATVSLCECGFYPSTVLCKCKKTKVNKVLSHLSKNILNNTDILLNIPKKNLEDYLNESEFAPELLEEQIEKARMIQRKRYGSNHYNGELTYLDIKRFSLMAEDTLRWLQNYMINNKMGMDEYIKCIRIARTIADLEGEELIMEKHFMEGFLYLNILTDNITGDVNG